MIQSVEIEQKNIEIISPPCFNLAITLDCGQAFRWRMLENGRWHGIIDGKVFETEQTPDKLIFYNTSEEDFKNILCKYFDLSRDYEALCEQFKKDKYLRQATEEYYGIRVLKQEPWETLCSFIISQNNNIPRIKGIIERLCVEFGENLGNGDFSFPTAKTLAKLDVDDLAPLRAGFRAKYILDAAKKVANGEVDLSLLSDIDIEKARDILTRIKGVGAKVAECTLLYGCGRVDAFPVDVWVKRILNEFYDGEFPSCTKGVEGIAQQYLFHWRRNMK